MTEVVGLGSGPLRMELQADLGARVRSLRYDATELLIDQSVHPSNWGATFWTSPQADWGWPPVVAVDSAPYQPDRTSSGVHLVGPPASIGPRRFRIEKRFSAGPDEGIIDAEYRIVNLGDEPFGMASWEISRVKPGGLSFFPTGAHELTPIEPHGCFETRKDSEMTWFDHRVWPAGESQKLHADGREGFLAHATDALLVLKLFVDHPSERQAPGEGEVELFANEDGKYVEIEVQGAYEQIAAGAQSVTRVRTVVRPLRALGSPELCVGSEELIEIARSLNRRYGLNSQ